MMPQITGNFAIAAASSRFCHGIAEQLDDIKQTWCRQQEEPRLSKEIATKIKTPVAPHEGLPQTSPNQNK